MPVLLGSMQPGVIVWGAEGVALYNDGFAAMLGERHPACFARPFRQMWAARWPEVEAALAAACAGNGSRLDEFVFAPVAGAAAAAPAAYAFALTPVRGQGGEVLGIYCACVETTWQFIARRETAAETERLRAMFEYAPGAIAIFSGPSHVMELANRAFQRLTGTPDGTGRPVAETLPPAFAASFLPLLDAVRQRGEPYLGNNVDIDMAPPTPGERPRRCTLDFVLQPVRDHAGTVSGIFAELQDVTEQAVAAKQQELLNREIGHRMKNQLAVVNGIVSQTLRNATDIGEVKTTLAARIGALARAQTALMEQPAGKAAVKHVVDAFLEVHGGGDRISATGPAISIAAKPALSLTLILHELGTNAAKYGALAVRGGRVAISWAIEERAEGLPLFSLRWQERGGPPVAAPAQASAGTRLIRAGLSGARDCRVDLAYDADGLICRITADLASISEEE